MTPYDLENHITAFVRWMYENGGWQFSVWDASEIENVPTDNELLQLIRRFANERLIAVQEPDV